MAVLDRLFNFSGPITEFWPALIENILEVFDMEKGLVLRRDRLASPLWEKVAEYKKENDSTTISIESSNAALQLATDVVAKGYVFDTPRDYPGESLLAFRLGQEEPGRDVVLVLAGHHAPPSFDEAGQEWLRLVVQAVRLQLLRRTGHRVAPEHAQIATALDLMILLNEQKQSLLAAMVLCNELASRFGATRVSLGWKRGEIVRLYATSHTNKFEKNVGIVLALENAMQETLDQDEEVQWPPAGDDFVVTREHEIYARDQVVGRILSLPVRVDGVAKGVLMLERNAPPFRQVEVAGLRIICDLAARRLDDLDRRSRGPLVRLKYAGEEWLARYFGPEHTWAKLAAVAGALALLFLVFWPWPYRIQGEFGLHPQTMVILPAPYEGYLKTVDVHPGDKVCKDQPLLSLDETEMQLQAAESQAGQMRYQSESALAQGTDRVSDMRIADAQYQQETNHLKESQFNLAHSVLRSPFDGVVVEGDLKERIGSPVKKGEALVKVCQLEGMYVRVEVPEADINRIRQGAPGQIAFASRPETTFPIVVDVIEPSAVAKKDGNVFMIRCHLQGAQPEWWRPGMMGIAKIDVGHASPLWLITHRLIDFLRMKLWL